MRLVKMEMQKNKISKILFCLSVYALAMAFVEAAVVVYLREIYYPAGFFVKSIADLAVMSDRILKVELWREAATIVMLASLAFLSFSEYKQKFAAFIWVFSLWDLFYYLFLYIILKWPTSIFDTDLYFLIPWPWFGPVWFPLALFSILVVGSFYFLYKHQK